MATTPAAPKIPRDVQALLGQLRRRIRVYVWAEGIAVAVLWVGLTFWAGLAIDYLPVLVGASEMPREARLILLSFIGAVLGWILYRFVLRRAFARLRDRSMAVLLERTFPHFKDSLLTTVELTDAQHTDDPHNKSMLSATTLRANEQIADVRLGRVFRMAPLVRRTAAAAVVVGSIVLMGIFAREALALWANRLYLLSDDPWPRRAHIELLGFQDGKLKVAKGSDLSIRVRADAKKTTPQLCTIIYRTDNGDRGRVNMSRDGEPREGHQHYVFAGKPFKGILDGIKFDVIGFDHRLRDHQIEVVDPPTLVKIDLRCTYPQYTEKGARTVPWSTGSHFPAGSGITVLAQANKPLRQVSIKRGESEPIKPELNDDDPRSFAYTLDRLEERVALEVELVDIDGIPSQQTQRITIGADEDRPPEVKITLRGIGSAITPQARIPTTGTIKDDWGVAETWFDIDIADQEGREFAVELQPGGKLDTALDLRRRQADDEAPLILKTSTMIVLSVQARDSYDLGAEPHVGTSDLYELDVVEPEELLARLEARELSLRRRFEQIIEETQTNRDSLLRVRGYWDAEQSSSSPDERLDPDQPEDQPLSAEAARKRAMSFQLLRVQRAAQHCEKSAQEVFGVATSFEDIREELINNRVDTEERKERLQKLIADPLHEIADPMFPELVTTLQKLEGKLDDSTAAIPLADQSLRQADEILLAMQQVLEQMLELETYNELVEIVRSIIKEQAALSDTTKNLRRQDLLDGLGP